MGVLRLTKLHYPADMRSYPIALWNRVELKSWLGYSKEITSELGVKESSAISSFVIEASSHSSAQLSREHLITLL